MGRAQTKWRCKGKVSSRVRLLASGDAPIPRGPAKRQLGSLSDVVHDSVARSGTSHSCACAVMAAPGRDRPDHSPAAQHRPRLRPAHRRRRRVGTGRIILRRRSISIGRACGRRIEGGVGSGSAGSFSGGAASAAPAAGASKAAPGRDRPEHSPAARQRSLPAALWGHGRAGSGLAGSSSGGASGAPQCGQRPRLRRCAIRRTISAA